MQDAILQVTKLLNDPKTTDRLTKLRDMSILFMTPAVNVVSVVNDLYSQGYAKPEVLALVKRRADYRVHGVQSPWARELFADSSMVERLPISTHMNGGAADGVKRSFLSRLQPIRDVMRHEPNSPLSSSPPWSPTSDAGDDVPERPRQPSTTKSATATGQSSPSRKSPEEDQSPKSTRSAPSLLTKFKSSSTRLFRR